MADASYKPTGGVCMSDRAFYMLRDGTSKSTKPVKDGLPEPEYYGLEKAAEKLKCTADDILRLGMDEHLRISYNFAYVVAAWVSYGCGGMWFDEELDNVNFITEFAHLSEPLGILPSDLKRLAAGDLVQPLRLLPTTLLPDDNAFLRHALVYREDFVGAPRVDVISMRGLVVARKELERFERDHLNVNSEAHQPSATAPETKRRPRRPENPNLPCKRIPELKADAIEAAKAFKAKHNRTPTVVDMARALSVRDKWCHFQEETIKPCLRAAWWK